MQTNKETPRTPSTNPVAPVPAGRSTSYLGPGLLIQGEISGNEDLRLDSTVDGLVSIGGFRLTLGPGGHVNGDIVAREALIAGEVTGDVRVRDRIEIAKSASIEGDLSTAKIVIEEGAYFKGNLDIGADNSQVGPDLDSLLGSKKTGEKL
jgi:cytoskeletal protein CcmA (bactofilin family)